MFAKKNYLLLFIGIEIYSTGWTPVLEKLLYPLGQIFNILLLLLINDIYFKSGATFTIK